MYKLIDDVNVKKDMENYVFLINPKLIYQVIDIEVKKYIKEEAETTLQVVEGGYVVCRKYTSGGQKETKTKVTQFEVKGDFAQEIHESLEKVKKGLFGENYINAKRQYRLGKANESNSFSQ